MSSGSPQYNAVTIISSNNEKRSISHINTGKLGDHMMEMSGSWWPVGVTLI